MFHKLLLRIERLVGLTRYEPIEDPRVVKALEPYDLTDCPHWGATNVTPFDSDITKPIFWCDDCKTMFRHKVAPGKPWLIVGYERVS